MSSRRFSGGHWNLLLLQAVILCSVSEVNCETIIPTNRGTFLWEQNIPAKQFQLTFCARECHESRLIATDDCSFIECFPCSCNKPLCQYYGTCCPDFHDAFPSNFSSPTSFDNSSRTTTSQHSLSSNTSSTVRYHQTLDEDLDRNLQCDISDRSYLYIRSCQSNFSESHVRARCEVNIPSDEQDLGTFLRVTDNVGGLTYFNKYCAICNDVTDFVYWKMEVKCEHYMNVYRARTTDELLRLALAPDSRCQVFKRVPDNVSLEYCKNDWIGAHVIGLCNVTREWDIYDEDVERACGETSGIRSRVRFTERPEKIYKNIFCALCNMKKYQNEFVLCILESIRASGWDGSSNDVLPFSMLLNFGSEESQQNPESSFNNCSHDTEWTSPDNRCFPLKCSPGKIIINGSCSTALPQVRGLVYQIQVMYLFMAPTKLSHSTETAEIRDRYNCTPPNNYLHQFQNHIEAILSNYVLEIDVNISIFYYPRLCSVQNVISLPRVNGEVNDSSLSNIYNNPHINWFTLDGFLLAPKSVSRDEVETFLINELITSRIHLSVGHNRSLTLTPMLAPYRRVQHFDCATTENEKLTYVNETLHRYPNLYSTFNMNKENVIFYKSYHTKVEYAVLMDKPNAIFLQPQITCPFVSFNSTQYLYNNISITLLVGGVSDFIFEIKELNMLSISGDGTLRVCRELLDMRINYTFPDNSGKNGLLQMSQYVLTLACMSASILCLAVTLMTYSLFPVLRSVAGKNNMFLCGSLLLAQSSLLTASHVQQNSHLCTFLAISTHFLWLSMFCWCFTSCLHMFRTFTAKTRVVQTTASAEKKYIIKRVVACTVVPALIVIAVVVTNYFTSQGKRIGYGRTTCFLDSPTLVGTTLVAPLCLVLICNVYFFTVTISKIHNIRKLQTGNFKKDDRKNLYIYVKLSSVTGMFWILAVISEATDYDPLRFIAVSLNGLQGVFIFLSYIYNKRVLKLYLRALGFEIAAPTSGSEKSTIAKVESDLRQLEMCDAKVESDIRQ